jgi:carboxylate-amine ligase
VQENKWRAARYGLDAWIIRDAESNERLLLEDLEDLLERLHPVAERLLLEDLEELLDRLRPVAERLRCVDDLDLVREIPRRGASYQRQRRVAEATDGDLVAVVDSVVREL